MPEGNLVYLENWKVKLFYICQLLLIFVRAWQLEFRFILPFYFIMHSSLNSFQVNYNSRKLCVLLIVALSNKRLYFCSYFSREVERNEEVYGTEGCLPMQIWQQQVITTSHAMSHKGSPDSYYPSILHIYNITCQTKSADLQLCGVATPIIYINIFIWYNCSLSVTNALLLEMSHIQFWFSSVSLPTMHNQFQWFS